MSEVPRAKIYTGVGDEGKTRLVDGSCVEKFNPRVEAYGCVDELNSQIGFVRSLLNSSTSEVNLQQELKSLNDSLNGIQNLLFCIGSLFATADLQMMKALPEITKNDIQNLEHQIDLLNAQLPELKNFILPGGHILGSSLHVARTFCRRAERRSAEILDQAPAYSECLVYLNRLSDYLFMAARWANMKFGAPEVIWKNPRKN